MIRHTRATIFACLFLPALLNAEERTLDVALLPFTSDSTTHSVYLGDTTGEGNTGEGSVAGGDTRFTSALLGALAAQPGMSLVDRNNLEKILKEAGLGLSGLVDESDAARVGKLAGAEVLVMGSTRVGTNERTATARIIGVETGRLFVVTAQQAASADEQALANELGSKIASRIAQEKNRLVATVETEEDKLAKLQQQVGNSNKPTVTVSVSERHIGRATGSIDPAAETEIVNMLVALGYPVLDPTATTVPPEVKITGEGFSEFATRNGELVSVKARLELKAVDMKTGRILAMERQTATEVDLVEQIAGKKALQKAAQEAGARLLPKLGNTTAPK